MNDTVWMSQAGTFNVSVKTSFLASFHGGNDQFKSLKSTLDKTAIYRLSNQFIYKMWHSNIYDGLF